MQAARSWSALCASAAVLSLFACDKQSGERGETTAVTVSHESAAGGASGTPIVADIGGSATKSDSLPTETAAEGPAVGGLPALPATSAAPATTTGPVGSASIGETAPVTGATTTLSGGQLLHFADTASSGELDESRKAVEKAHDPRVRAFAEKMVKDQIASKEADRALAQKLGTPLAGNPLSVSLKKYADAMAKPVAGTTGGRFDQAFMLAQVGLQEYLVKELDDEVLPQASSGDLKTYFTRFRQHAAEHLEEARATLRGLGSDATATK